jgi:hypothetical protein
VKDLTFALRGGERLLVTGPSGCGKSRHDCDSSFDCFVRSIELIDCRYVPLKLRVFAFGFSPFRLDVVGSIARVLAGLWSASGSQQISNILLSLSLFSSFVFLSRRFVSFGIQAKRRALSGRLGATCTSSRSARICLKVVMSGRSLRRKTNLSQFQSSLVL